MTNRKTLEHLIEHAQRQGHDLSLKRTNGRLRICNRDGSQNLSPEGSPAEILNWYRGWQCAIEQREKWDMSAKPDYERRLFGLRDSELYGEADRLHNEAASFAYIHRMTLRDREEQLVCQTRLRLVTEEIERRGLENAYKTASTIEDAP